MQPKLLVQTALLLMLGQALLGGIGYLARDGLAVWPALALLPLMAWLVVRTATVLRGEMTEAVRRGAQVVPWRAALTVAVLWQVPTLFCLPLWAPYWPAAQAAAAWQGVLVPVLGVMDLLWPGTAAAGTPWLWPASLLWAGAFMAVAGKPLPVQPPIAKPVGAPSGQPPAAKPGRRAPAAAKAMRQVAAAEQPEAGQADERRPAPEEEKPGGSGAGQLEGGGAEQESLTARATTEWKPALRHADVMARTLSGQRKRRRR